MDGEPVGNGPRMNIPGNSHKKKADKAEKKEPVVEREAAEKVIEGKVVLKKTPWYKKAARSMVADDVTNVGDYVLVDVIIPAVKNLLFEIVTQGAGRTLYGQGGRKGRFAGGGGSSLGGNLRTRYHDAPTERPRVLSQRGRSTHDFGEIVLETREEAIEAIRALDAEIDRYGSATVGTLYEILGVTGSYMDQKWGWTNLRDADVVQRRDGWLLDLPPTEPIR